MRPIPGVIEADFTLGRLAGPAHLAELDCTITQDTTGEQWTVPCFWRGAERWGARFRPRTAGAYTCTVEGAEPVHVSVERLEDDEAKTAPELQSDGAILRTGGGEPFLWLADTWWFGLSDRISDDEFGALLDRRRQQGFSAIQIVAGLYPEIYSHDPLGDTDGRWPWVPGYFGLDPQWWETADDRIAAITAAGLVPAIVGAWSYYLPEVGAEVMRAHWRQIIARWSALPVVWCIAGEAGLPKYEELSRPDLQQIGADLAAQWREITAYARALDPHHRPVTVHPCPAFHFSSTEVLGGRDLIDLVWLQTGHADRMSVPDSLAALDREVATEPMRPVVNSEVCYEGIAGGSDAPLQRFLFWSHLLSGAAGHTYGAQGLWGFRHLADDGPGAFWGSASWQAAAALPGAAYVGIGARVLRDLRWHELRPRPDIVSPRGTADDRFGPYAAASDRLAVVYFPPTSLRLSGTGLGDYGSAALRLDEGRWSVRYRRPAHRSGDRHPAGHRRRLGPAAHQPRQRVADAGGLGIDLRADRRSLTGHRPVSGLRRAGIAILTGCSMPKSWGRAASCSSARETSAGHRLPSGCCRPGSRPPPGPAPG